jgi:hypothetical protein
MRVWVQAQLAQAPAADGVPAGEQRRVLAVDGKTVRGAHLPIDRDDENGAENGAENGGGDDRGYRQPHLVAVLDQASGAVLGQVSVEEKGSEVAAFTTLLNDLDLTDVLVTADAVHTNRNHINRNHANYLHERGGRYLLTAKRNQPTLLRRLRALPWAQIGVAARNAAVVTAGSRPAPSAWSASTPARTGEGSSSRAPPRPSRSSAAVASWAAADGPR